VRVLITTTYYLPNVSGITIYVNVLAEELARRGNEVTILTSWHDKNTLREEILNGVKIKREPVWFYIGKGPIYPSFLWSSVKEILRADVINCHLPQPESLWVAFWSRLFNKKVFLTHHTDLSFWKGIKNKIIDSGVFVCQFLACTLATGIIPYTNDYANHSYLLKYFLKKVHPIYPPIKFKKTTDKNLDNQIKKIIKSKKYVIGFCGRIAKQKGIELLIESTKILDKRLGDKYVILMAGPKKVIGEHYYEYLESKYKKRLADKFIFLDNIPRKVLSVFYKNIDLLVLPSDDILESFGWVQIEAMKCGVPCVATNLPGMRIPIKKTNMGELFEKNNKDDLARKLIKVLDNGKKYYKKSSSKLSKFEYMKTIEDYELIFGK
jgi:glycosyltransferase involved in cell wall biosynthesis